jgi:hypothetical protein
MSDDWLARLSTVLPPPDAPIVGEVTWEAVAGTLGIRFPPDFRRLVDTYGSGWVGDELNIASPRATAFPDWAAPPLDAIRDVEPEGADSPLPAYPAPGPSLLPIASNGNGDYLFMVVTDGVADEARLWLGNIRNIMWQLVLGPVSRLLVDVLTSGRTAEDIIANFGDFAWTPNATFTPKALDGT